MITKMEENGRGILTFGQLQDRGIQDRELEGTEAGGSFTAPEVCDVH